MSKKKKVKIDPVDYEKSLEYDGEHVDVYSVNYDGKKFEGLKINGDRVLILPYDKNEFGQIKRIYVSRFFNFIEEETQMKSIICSYDEEEDTSLLNTVKRASFEKLGITSSQFEAQWNNADEFVSFLGQIDLNEGVNGTLRCYAIDVTKLAKTPRGFEPKVQDEPSYYTIEPILFADVIRGEYSSSLILSSSLLLLSILD